MKKSYLYILALLSLNSCGSITRTTSYSGENELLVRSLRKYNRQANDKNYSAVVHQLENGDFSLFVRAAFDNENFTDPSETQFEIINKEGLKLLIAFTSKEKLSNWAKKDAPYVAVKSKDLEELSRQNSIHRILIDPEQDTFFVLEKYTGLKKYRIQDNSVKIGPTGNFLSASDRNNLSLQFSSVQPILEAYGFKMMRGDKITFVIGFVLKYYSEDSQQACFYAVQNALDLENRALPIELFMFENNESILNTVQNDENSLLFRR